MKVTPKIGGGELNLTRKICVIYYRWLFSKHYLLLGSMRYSDKMMTYFCLIYF